MRRYFIIDIYGDEWDYFCKSEEEARDYFDIENGKDNFENFLVNLNEDRICQ